MNCEETQKNLSAFLDDQLTHGSRAALEAHLDACPVCRLRLGETRALVRRLAVLERPAPPADLVSAISASLMIERAARLNQPVPSFTEQISRWVRPRLMPYTVGAFASLLLFFSVTSALRPQFGAMRALALAAAREEAVVPAAGPREFDVTRPISLATSRAPFGSESPSLNPGGALAALVRTPSSGSEEDDDTVIVADVFSNGSASLAGVVSPPRNPQMLDEVQDALRRNPAFVPAAFDHRPQTMRVVLSLSKVSVHERSF
ncbi:MAG: anti-sigma factor [Acidobacteriota bacterium]|nr:anti-sigma factor [Acidobacteriota bacterium]